jgi:hypothetical protein
VVLPSGLATGSYSVTAVTPEGTTDGATLPVAVPPTVTSVACVSTSDCGPEGSQLKVSGTELAGVTVYFGSVQDLDSLTGCTAKGSSASTCFEIRTPPDTGAGLLNLTVWSPTYGMSLVSSADQFMVTGPGLSGSTAGFTNSLTGPANGCGGATSSGVYFVDVVGSDDVNSVSLSGADGSEVLSAGNGLTSGSYCADDGYYPAQYEGQGNEVLLQPTVGPGTYTVNISSPEGKVTATLTIPS